MKTVLVTGGTGFIGQHLINGLFAQGYAVVLLVRGGRKISSPAGDLRIYETDEVSINKAFEIEAIDCVIHLASCYGRNEDFSDIVNANLCFAIRVLNASIKYNVNHFINTDSFFRKYLSNQTYMSDYILTKSQFLEWLVHEKNRINVINMVLHHVYGPNDSQGKFFPWLIEELLGNSDSIELTSCENLRDFIYIDDVVGAYMLVVNNLSKIKGFVEFDVGTGVVLPVSDAVRELVSQMQLNGYGKGKKILLGALPNKGLDSELIIPDIEGLSFLGWQPEFDIEKGMKNYIELESKEF